MQRASKPKKGLFDDLSWPKAAVFLDFFLPDLEGTQAKTAVFETTGQAKKGLWDTSSGQIKSASSPKRALFWPKSAQKAPETPLPAITTNVFRRKPDPHKTHADPGSAD
jgi:hypothetical protein